MACLKNINAYNKQYDLYDIVYKLTGVYCRLGLVKMKK
jgi:hypothetical protein